MLDRKRSHRFTNTLTQAIETIVLALNVRIRKVCLGRKGTNARYIVRPLVFSPRECMAKTKKTTKKTSKRWWRPESGPSVSFFRHGQFVLVDFLYRPDRVKAIKAIATSRYNAEDKGWRIAISDYHRALALPEFAGVGVLEGVYLLEEPPLEMEEALQCLRNNPFGVAERAIAGAPVGVIVRLADEAKRLKIVARIGHPAYRILQRLPSAVFCALDKAYTLPACELASFVKRCRDKNILFAIEEHAGAVLKETAPARQSLEKEPTSATDRELEEALLTPFVATCSEGTCCFEPRGFTREQLKLAFPGLRRQQGKPVVLNEREIIQLAGRISSLPFPIWLSRDVHSFISSRREEIIGQIGRGAVVLEDSAADLLGSSCLWKTVESGRGALLINGSINQEVRTLISDLFRDELGASFPDSKDDLLLEVPDSKLLSIKQEVDRLCADYGEAPFPVSQSLERLLSDCGGRVRLLEQARFYAGLEDIACDEIRGLAPDESKRLFPHQRVAVSWLMKTPYAFLGDDMGLGKTLSVLSYFWSLRNTDDYSLLLVVCPNSLSRNWAREVAMWFPGLRVHTLSGDKKAKAWNLRLLSNKSTACDVLILNYEAVRLDYVTPEVEALVCDQKTLLCLDESQRIKNPSGKTFKAVNQIASACDRRVLLSGTPTPKDVSDIWAQMRIADGGLRLGRSYYRWLSKVAELGTEFSKYAVKKFRDEEVRESIHRVHEVMLRRRKEHVVNLPAKTFSLREVELQGTQLERYNEIREGLMLRMRSLSGEQFVREITNILEEYLRAVQVASNPRLIDPQWTGEPAKFLELDELVREVVDEQRQKMVIWTNYLGNIKELCDRYKSYGAAPFSGEVSAADREKTVRAFQEESTPSLLVAVPAAGGVGITLTAAQTAVYLEKTWNAEHWMQSVDRIHRIGQTGTVNIISLVGCKVDEIIHWNLRRKEKGQAETLGDYADSNSQGMLVAGISREELMDALMV